MFLKIEISFADVKLSSNTHMEYLANLRVHIRENERFENCGNCSLLCDQVKEIHKITEDVCLDDEKLEKIWDLVDDCYKSDKTDVEDLCDCLNCISSLLVNVIKDSNFTDEQVIEFLDLRMRTKKLINKKMREGHDYFLQAGPSSTDLNSVHMFHLFFRGHKQLCKEDEKPRYYWGYENCLLQYKECVSLWKSSLTEILKILPQFRSHFKVNGTIISYNE